MFAQVKKCIDNNDIKGLRYVFYDSLDVDPTFEKYRADYEICKGIQGFFEPYTELTPLSENRGSWDLNYWYSLKRDLEKNFSLKRFEHMRTVATVVFAQKSKQLEDERIERMRRENAQKYAQDLAKEISQRQSAGYNVPSQQKSNITPPPKPVGSGAVSPVGHKTQQQLEDERIERMRRENAQKYAQDRAKENSQQQSAGYNTQNSNSDIKKAVGIVLGVVAVGAVATIILVNLL